MPGQDCTGVNPMNVSVARLNGSWKVVDEQSWLLDSGGDKSAADQAAPDNRAAG